MRLTENSGSSWNTVHFIGFHKWIRQICGGKSCSSPHLRGIELKGSWKYVPKKIRKLFSKLVSKIKFMGSLLWIFIPHFQCVGSFLQNVFLVQIWTLLSLYWISVGNFPTKCRKISYRWILAQENFLHTSVKCYTSAGKFPTHTVQIWIFLSSAGNMIPTLQPPNTGALSLWLSFLISSEHVWNQQCDNDQLTKHMIVLSHA